MKTKKKESVNQLKRQINTLRKRNSELEEDRNRYRSLVVEIYKASLDCIEDKEKNLLIKPSFVIKRSSQVFARSESFYLGDV